MVEGHSVHRVAASHRIRLVGKKFACTSPNGRFTEGAAAINNKPFRAIEAVGKNLFAWFGKGDADDVCVHVHFGMAGNWAVFEGDASGNVLEPATTTTRLRMEGGGVVSHLSAMTVKYGSRTGLYEPKRATLGEDPLREDADVERLWKKVSRSKKSIGALIMDQSCFCGPGNIYRAEILFKARIHPDQLGKDLSRAEFDKVWRHSVELLQRGFREGSILTVDPADDARYGPDLRRYVYNKSRCPICRGPVMSWTSRRGRPTPASPASRCARSRRRRRRPKKTKKRPAASTPTKAKKAKASPTPVKRFRSHCVEDAAERHVPRDAHRQGAQGQADGAGGAHGRPQVGARRAADGSGADDALGRGRGGRSRARGRVSRRRARRRPPPDASRARARRARARATQLGARARAIRPCARAKILMPPALSAPERGERGFAICMIPAFRKSARAVKH